MIQRESTGTLYGENPAWKPAPTFIKARLGCKKQLNVKQFFQSEFCPISFFYLEMLTRRDAAPKETVLPYLIYCFGNRGYR
ncbi:MAG: hypothetical protein QNK37_29420, partial [Acidobacteriota bacterium]|nr:hypothetical protein [Acidobacteriota bacterium]